jgi:transportin-1
VDPELASLYVDQFLKQFCLSLRSINDSIEKREAFKYIINSKISGLCNAIIHNPNGVINHFAFFCDAICQYDNSPQELENMFQNLIFSYKNTLKGKWNDYLKLFPEKLKQKMNERFK